MLFEGFCYAVTLGCSVLCYVFGFYMNKKASQHNLINKKILDNTKL